MNNYRFLEQTGFRKELTTYHYDPGFDYHRVNEILKIYLAYTKAEEAQHPFIDELGRLRMTKGYCVYQYDAKKDGIIRMMQHLDAPVN